MLNNEKKNLTKAILRELPIRDRIYALNLIASGISLPTYLLSKLGR